MPIRNETSLVKNGYQIIRNAVPKNLVKKIQIEILRSIRGKITGNWANMG